METKHKVGSLIRAKRGKMTTRAFAEKYGMSSAVLSQLENNKIPTPTMNTISAVAKALELPVLTVCSMYNICDENDTKETNQLTPEQALIKALGDYGVPQERMNELMLYIDHIVFDYIVALGTPRHSRGVHYDPTKKEQIKDMLVKFRVPEMYRLLEHLSKDDKV